MKYFIYKFIDDKEQVIYVGRTDNIERRINTQHFNDNGHLPKSCYAKCKYVKYATVNSINEARIYEIYFITKYKPQYNTVFADDGTISLELPTLNWIQMDIKNPTIIINDVFAFEEIIDKNIRNILLDLKTIEIFEIKDDVEEKYQGRLNAIMSSIKTSALQIQECKNQYFKSVI